MAPTTRRESASEISRRYGLADLVKTRMLARRLYVNALARRASVGYHDTTLDILDPELPPYEVPVISPRDYYLPIGSRYEHVVSRPGLPGMETRLMYNRRLAEMEAARLEAADRAERVIAQYMTRSQAKQLSDKNNKETDKDNNENNNEEDKETQDKETDAEVEDALVDDIYGDGLDGAYIDMMTEPYDPIARRRARALWRRHYYPYRFRPLPVTTRMVERRLRDL